MSQIDQQIEGIERRRDPLISLAKDIFEDPRRRRTGFVGAPLSAEFQALSTEDQQLVIKLVNELTGGKE